MTNNIQELLSTYKQSEDTELKKEILMVLLRIKDVYLKTIKEIDDLVKEQVEEC